MIRGKTRHQLFLPDELSKRLTQMARSQKRARSDLLLEMVETYLNRRAAPEVDERILVRLDRIARFIRHQLIYAAALPAPGAEAQALGEKRYRTFLDTVARMMAENDNEPPGEES